MFYGTTIHWLPSSSGLGSVGSVTRDFRRGCHPDLFLAIFAMNAVAPSHHVVLGRFRFVPGLGVGASVAGVFGVISQTVSPAVIHGRGHVFLIEEWVFGLRLTGKLSCCFSTESFFVGCIEMGLNVGPCLFCRGTGSPLFEGIMKDSTVLEVGGCRAHKA